MKDTHQLFIDAIQTGEIETVEALLDDDNSLSETMTDQGISVLLLASYLRKENIVNALLRKRSALTIFEAAATGQKEIFQQELNANPHKLNEWSSDGFTLIGLACFFGKKEIVKLLLDNNADVNIPSNNDFRVAPIHSAVAAQEIEIVKLLLENGAKVNALQMNGVTPLHSAAHLGNEELVKFLLENGADKSLRVKDGKTAIDFAREGNFLELLPLLTLDN